MRAIWPFRHIGLKLLSVAIAVLLWTAIAGEETEIGRASCRERV